MQSQTPRARSVSELVDAAFTLYRRDAGAYIMVTAIAVLPGLVAQLLLLNPTGAPGMMTSLGAVIVAIFSVVTYALMTGVVTKVGSDVYLGGEADIAAAVRHTLPLIGSLVWAAILRSIFYFLHALLLFFPVFIAFAKYFAPEAAIILEGKNASAALKRSVDLSDGIRWHIFGTLVLGYGIYFLLGIGLGVLGLANQSQMIALFAQTLLTIVAYPIIGLLTMLLYYDARIRKEGFDVEHLARSLDAPPAPAAR
jgi:uncharacterized membrane protein